MTTKMNVSNEEYPEVRRIIRQLLDNCFAELEDGNQYQLKIKVGENNTDIIVILRNDRIGIFKSIRDLDDLRTFLKDYNLKLAYRELGERLALGGGHLL
ncbi:gp56 [Listeria phage P40]|uniref:gp56 n=1 Tax=Listeria phage P40 TaxID=560178 RepID=UPI0001819905|nr:gp56 [Listeria phage P40]ACI00416.1 gp56 [Listeria phage P40]